MKFKILGSNMMSGTGSVNSLIDYVKGKKFDEITKFDYHGDTDHIEFAKDRIKFTDQDRSMKFGWFFEELWVFENGKEFTAYGNCENAEYVKQIKTNLKKVAKIKSRKS